MVTEKMKKIFVLLLFLTSINFSRAMSSSTMTFKLDDVKNNIECLKQDASCDILGIIALNDVKQGIKNPSHKVSYEPSKKLLQSIYVVDDNGLINKEICEHFEVAQSDENIKLFDR